MSILIGTQGWNYTAWVGPLYPPRTRASEFLPAYARAFRAVEVDSTFYAIPDARVVRAWAERTPPEFTFALKMPKEVTHERRLRDADDVVRDFLGRARQLGAKLGPVLLQMGPDFGPDELPAIETFLPTLPGDLRFAIELRQSRWMRPSAAHSAGGGRERPNGAVIVVSRVAVSVRIVPLARRRRSSRSITVLSS